VGQTSAEFCKRPWDEYLSEPQEVVLEVMKIMKREED